MIAVVAAIAQRDGRVLVCQRRRDARFPLKWEFPGGKARAGETAEQALARELAEELGVECKIGREIYRTRHRYEELAEEVELRFFTAELAGEPRNLGFERIEWAEAGSLAGRDFLPADGELVRLLRQGAVELD